MNIVKFCSLGGIGDVTKNIYLYETENDLVIVDCGVGFPDINMPGVDLIIPDISYILEHKEKLRAILITHAHEDHIGALPYIWPKLQVPIYATKLVAAFIENKFRDYSIGEKVRVVNNGDKIRIGDFDIEYIHVNHSVPDSSHIALTVGNQIFYHGSDFKFDWTPIDGEFSDVSKIAQVGQRGITCLLSDCLRSEREGYTLSERVVEDQLEREMKYCRGKFIVTAHSSDIYRWQMVVNVAKKYNRQIILMGRSVEQAIDISRLLNYLDLPQGMLIDSRKAKNYPDSSLCILAAGSQGQAGSALSRIANNDHPHIKIKEGDVVVFSADPIPGNENFVHSTIDSLTKLGASVSYSEVNDELHVSGHGASGELKMLMALTKPKYLIPIGGTYRHMKKYSSLAQGMGFAKQNVFLLDTGQQVVFTDKNAQMGTKLELKNVLIDGIGIGDVGSIVLRDRQQMAKDGMVVLILPIEQSTGQIIGEIELLSRGFVYMKQSDTLIKEAIKNVRKAIEGNERRITDWQFLRKKAESTLEKFFYKKTARRPTILSVIVEV
jgi:ribonuclease J